MSQFRANSSPDLDFSGTAKDQKYDDLALQGVAANVKLLLKLIQDHQIACDQDKNDHRRMLRVATMMTILDNAKDRIQKCQSFGLKKPDPELRRCNTDLRSSPVPSSGKKPGGEAEVVPLDLDEEKDRLRRELSSSIAAQRNLKAMCSSLGKEKKFMEAELSKKVHELSEMEELLNNLKAQNETLRQKVQECLSDPKEGKPADIDGGGGGGGGEMHAAVVLQEQNKALSEQLMRSLDGYRSMKRKLKASLEENTMLHSTVDEVGAKVVGSLERVKGLKNRMATTSSPPSEGETSLDLLQEIEGLEGMFECFQMLVEKHEKRQGDCARLSGEINAYKPSVLA
ncbi:hypothetical protein SASPL_117070 [Salvia splendens]|uniref:Uncharacterized protein n=1 Tax=Salvia splendens TaxID=180675 RepID=A0A8X8ZXF2_SALSN|nr:uncharacterized protein LOC121808181 [Salvia splendens]KAG6420538.1 hypothetical protein SASPL_117070 [Salvia splendens]